MVFTENGKGNQSSLQKQSKKTGTTESRMPMRRVEGGGLLEYHRP